MSNQPIIIERTFPVSAATVWKALTEKEEMKKWYFDLAEFKAQVGFLFSFTGGKDDRQYLHLCEITEVIVEKKLTYSWRYDGYEGISYVSFELFAEGDHTRLVLTHTGLENFPTSNPDFDKSNFVAGWTYIIHTSLKDFLEPGNKE